VVTTEFTGTGCVLETSGKQKEGKEEGMEGMGLEFEVRTSGGS